MNETHLWSPAPRVAATNITAFRHEVERRTGRLMSDYAALYDWSVQDSDDFWSAQWDYAGVRASERGTTVLVDGERMRGAHWFPDARLNYAESLLTLRGDADALVLWGEDAVKRRLSWRELHDQVSRFAQALQAQGVRPSNGVAGYLPNLPG